MAETGGIVVPVEALRVSGGGPNRPLRGVSGQPLAAPEGTYWVQALLPGDDGMLETSNAEEVVVRAGAESRVVLGGEGSLAEAPPATESPEPFDALVSFAAPSLPPPREVAGLARWTSDRPRRLMLAGGSCTFVLVDGRWEFLAVIPGVEGGSTTVSVTPVPPEADGATAFPSLRLSFGDPLLDGLWHSAAARSMGMARVMAEAFVRQGEAAPALPAALACYVLMRIGWDGDLLGFASAALARAPDQADLLVVKAELLSRQGRHDEAAACLATLGTGAKPWPTLRPGIDYARKRIANALQLDQGGSGLATVAGPILLISAMMDPDALYLLLRTADAEKIAASLYGVSSPAAPAPPPPGPAAARSSE